MGEAANETRKGVKAMSNESEAESVRAVRPGGSLSTLWQLLLTL